jgi:hypothetical protein
MSPTKRNGVFYLYVPKQSGGVALRTTGTKDVRVYRGMKRMLAEWKDARRWALLGAIVSGRLTLGQCYDAHVANTADVLEASLSAVALSERIPTYLDSLRGRGKDDKYIASVERHLKHFVEHGPAPTSSHLNRLVFTRWLAGLTDIESGTRRQWFYSVTGFARFLCAPGVDVLSVYPFDGMKAPDKNEKRERWETEANDRRIVDAASLKYRAVFAFLKSTGADVSTAFRTFRRDIDLERRRVLIRGKKGLRRKVPEARIEAWAIPYLTEYCRDKLPNALLWPPGSGEAGRHGRAETPFYSMYGCRSHHEKCCKALGIADYTLKDARHSVAVRMRFEGYDFEQIAGQLGNSPAVVADVYARFEPDMNKKSGAV